MSFRGVHLKCLVLVTALALVGEVRAQATQPSITGPSNGQISLPGAPLKFAVQFANAGEALKGTIDIQAAKDLDLSDVVLSADQIRFKVPGVPGDPSFAGTWQGDSIVGTFTQRGASFPFELRRGE